MQKKIFQLYQMMLGCMLIWSVLSLNAEEPYAPLDLPKPTTLKVQKANSPHGAYSGGHRIDKAIDGSLATANWHAPGISPVIGEFEFEPPQTIDYILFQQANFKKVNLSATLSDGSVKNLGDFSLSNGGLLRFKTALNGVKKIRMEVNYNPNEGKSFAVREIEFVQKAINPYESVIKQVFKDASCSELNSNATPAQIKMLPSFLQVVAQKLKSKSYPDAEFRLGNYKAYSKPEFAAKVRNINALSPLDNPTGIYANEGEEILVFVGDTHGENISLCSVSPAGISSTDYPLEPGTNKVTIKRTGLLYIKYHTDIATPKKPIRVHIPIGNGKVNGYFDVTRHSDADYQRMLQNAHHTMFDIVGKNAMMILHTEYLKKYSPEVITPSVQVWDLSVAAMWKIMGFEKYPQPHNNRQLGVSVVGGPHMFATWYYCGYSVGNQGVTMRNEVLAPGILTGNRLWGIGHEIGHCYQHPMNWRSMSESSNNFFAQLILDQVVNPINGNEKASDMENPCKYLLEQAVKGVPFHNMNGWSKFGFAQCSFYLYFHKLGINPDFYPDLFESLRQKPLSKDAVNITEAHLEWYERVCEIGKTDFTEDFETFNWFVPFNIEGNQYGKYTMHLTQKLADESKARVAARHYPKPKFRVAFLHQHGKTVNLWGQNLHGSQLNGYWKNYLKEAPLSTEVTARKEGNRIYVQNGGNAAAFCVKTQGKIVGYFDRSQFDVDKIAWDTSSEVYAIPMQANQPFKKIYPAPAK